MADVVINAKQRILMQLAAQRAAYKFDYGSVDWDETMTNIFADFLVGNDIQDLADIAQFNAAVPFGDDINLQYTNLNYFYNRRTGLPIKNTSQDVIDQTDMPYEMFFYQRLAEEWVMNVAAKFDSFGRVFFIFAAIPQPKGKSGWALVRDLHSPIPSNNFRTFKFMLASMGYGAVLIMIIISIYVPGLGAALGAFIVGPATAAAYPLLAQAIGSIIMNTLMSGGDIETGIKNGLIGTVAGPYGAAALNAVQNDNSDSWKYLIVSVAAGSVTETIGQTTAIEFDSQLAGSVAKSATQALLVGDSVQDAVTQSLVRSTGSALNTVISTAPDRAGASAMMGSLGSDDYEYIDDSSVIPEDAWNFDLPSFDFDFSDIDFSFSDPSFGTDFYGDVGDDFGDSFNGGMPDASHGLNDMGTIDLDSPDLSSSFDMEDVWSGLGDLVKLAIKAIPAVKAMNSNSAKAATAGSTRVNPNGTVTTVTSGGVPITSKPAVGQPVVDAAGNAYVNNGNGTYTVVRSNGQSQTLPYTAPQSASGGIDTKTILIGGGIVAGLLLLSRR